MYARRRGWARWELALPAEGLGRGGSGGTPAGDRPEGQRLRGVCWGDKALGRSVTVGFGRAAVEGKRTDRDLDVGLLVHDDLVDDGLGCGPLSVDVRWVGIFGVTARQSHCPCQHSQCRRDVWRGTVMKLGRMAVQKLALSFQDPLAL